MARQKVVKRQGAKLSCADVQLRLTCSPGA